MLASKVPSHVLNGGKGECPQKMKQNLLPLLGLGENLIPLNEIKHGSKGAPMQVQAGQLNNQAPLALPNNANGKENPQAPKAHHDNGFQRQRDQMKPGQEQLNLQFAFLLVE